MRARAPIAAVAGAVAATLVALALAPAGADAQAPSPYRLRSVSPHAHGTAVAVALRLHAGSQDDQEGFEGTAWLLGRVLEDQARRVLDPADGVLTVTVERATTTFTLLALPDAWERAWARVDALVFDHPLDGALLERHRAELLERLAFEAGSPFRDFETEAAELLAEPGSPFARPPRGTPSSVASVSPLSLELYRSSFFRRDAAVQAVVGPVAADGEAPPPPASPPVADVAWLTGDRASLVQDVTSTWIAVAYPAPSDLPRTRLELVAHLLEEELDPTPPPPDRYSLDVRLEETPRGPVLVVEASVFPEAAQLWEERILGVVRRLAGEPMGEDFFRWRRRRFRAARLLEESAPEAEARRITADLLRDGRARDLGVEIWALDAAALQAAAGALGPPRILLLGPDLGQNGTRKP